MTEILKLIGQLPMISESAGLIINLGTETEVNRVLLQEYIKLGQSVRNLRFKHLLR